MQQPREGITTLTINYHKEERAMSINRDEKTYSTSGDKKLLNLMGVVFALFMFYASPPLSVLLFGYLLLCQPLLAPLLLLYLGWIYLDRNTPHRGGRRFRWMRSLKIFQHFRDYFPQVLVKTADLPPTNNYIFCVFPHGILCTGAHAQFASENPQFEKYFPGIDVTCHTLNSNFYYPFSREYVLAIGFCSVSKEALVRTVGGEGRGRASVLVVGGSAEAMVSQPGSHRAVLRSRKGFAKLSYTTGAQLVPIYIFGETDLYKQWIFPSDSIIHKIQQTVRKFTGIAPVLARGRGFFQNSFGLLPYSTPVYTVVGKPIPVEKKENPTREEVNSLHARFVEELTQLFDKHKYSYLPKPDTTFLSIED